MFRRSFAPFKRFFSNGPLAGREHALEEKFIHDHEVEVIKKLKQELAAREKRLAEHLAKNPPKAAPAAAAGKAPSGKDRIHLNPVSASAGSFAKREAAAEEQYFRTLEKEKLDHLKKSDKK